MPLKRMFHLRVSRSKVIGTAITVAKLLESVSEAVGFAPTKGAAQIIQQILGIIKEVDNNEDVRVALAARTVTLLLAIRELLSSYSEPMPQSVLWEMQEFETVLVSIRDKLESLSKKKYAKRALTREFIKGELASKEYRLETAFRSLQITITGNINSTVLRLEDVADRIKLVTRRTEETMGLTLSEVQKLARASDANRAIVYEIQENTGTVLAKLQSVDAPLSHANTWPRATNSNQCTDAMQQSDNPNTDEDELDRYGFDRIHPSKLKLESQVESGVVFLSHLVHAKLGGEKVLVKKFEEEDAKLNWLREIRHWQNLYHPNLPQMVGFSSQKSAHYFVVFQDIKMGYMANYIMETLKTQSTQSCINTFIKFGNEGLSAIKHAEKQLNLNASTSALIAQEAEFSLDADNKLIVTLQPVSALQVAQGKKYSISQQLYFKLIPPLDTRKTTTFLTSLAGSNNESATVVKLDLDQRRKISFFDSSWNYNHRLNKIEVPKVLPSDLTRWTASVFVDYRDEVTAGDYGFLVPGKEQEFSFVCLGNAIDDSPEIFSSTRTSLLWDYTSSTYVDPIQESPHVWPLNFTQAHSDGFDQVIVQWKMTKALANRNSQAYAFLLHSAPLLTDTRKGLTDLILVSKVDQRKGYGFTLRGKTTGDDVTSTPDLHRLASRQLPMVYAKEPTAGIEIDFTQCQPGSCPPACKFWDNSVKFDGVDFERSRIWYVQLSEADLASRYKSPLAGRKGRSRINLGSITRTPTSKQTMGLGAQRFHREYEIAVQHSKRWGLRKEFSKEYQ